MGSGKRLLSPTGLYGAGRLVLGGALAVAPAQAAQPWLGGGVWHRSTRDAVRLLGVRDAVIGFGLLDAQRRGGPVRPWLVAAMVADAADAVLAGAEASRSQRVGAVVTTVAATSGALTAALLLRRADRHLRTVSSSV